MKPKFSIVMKTSSYYFENDLQLEKTEFRPLEVDQYLCHVYSKQEFRQDFQFWGCKPSIRGV